MSGGSPRARSARGFLESGTGPARCETAVPPDSRASARRIWHGFQSPPRGLVDAAGYVVDALPGGTGKVHEHPSPPPPDALDAIAALLPSPLQGALRRTLQWYACRGAFFHTDAHFAGVLFGVWCIRGPAREIAFSRLRLRAPAAAGDAVVFDPFEPHAVLDPRQPTYHAEHYLGTEPSVFVGFELALQPVIREAFGVDPEAVADAPRLSSRSAVNAETGALAAT